MRKTRAELLAALLFFAGCSFFVGCSGEATLIVQVRTDLSPGLEFTAIETQVEGLPLETLTADEARDWGRGVRVAEITVEPGAYRATVSAVDASGVVVRRPLRVDVEGATVVTVLLTRDCQGVICDDPSASACLGGRCVAEDCVEERDGVCGDPACTNDASCDDGSASGCAQYECTASGSCFVSPTHGMCADEEVCDVADGCVSSMDPCGNGMLDTGEVCDTAVAVATSCSTLGPFADGTLACAEGCRDFDFSGCTFASDCDMDGRCDPGETFADCSFDCSPAVVGAGATHTCVGFVNTGVSCWGSNEDGELGDGMRRSRSYSMPVMSPLSADLLAGGAGTTCAVDGFNDLRCWGRNDLGQLGLPVMASVDPTRVGTAGDYSRVSLGREFGCAVSALGANTYCSGGNGEGQLGNGTRADSPTPIAVSGMRTLSAITSREQTTCAVTDAGGVVCWGANGSGQLGDGSRSSDGSPTPPTGLGSGVARIAVGARHACALLDTGAVRCWGDNSRLQLGSDTLPESLTPVDVQRGFFTEPRHLVAGEAHTCVVEMDGTVLCWGANDHGQLGRGTRADSHEPQPVVGVVAFPSDIYLTAGNEHTCAVTATGLFCWGAGEQGQLGDGRRSDQPTPVRALGL